MVHLFERRLDCRPTHAGQGQIRRYFALDEYQHIWSSFVGLLNTLTAVDIRPRGLRDDVQAIGRLTAQKASTIKMNKSVDLHTLSKILVPYLSVSNYDNRLIFRKMVPDTDGMGPWEQHMAMPDNNFNSSEAEWIKIAYINATVLHTVYDEMWRKIRRTQMSRFSASPV